MDLLDPLTNTVTARTLPEPSPIECPTCGASVTNTTRHEEWHEMFVPKPAQSTDARVTNVRRLFGQAG